jgi:hypothetical protein
VERSVRVRPGDPVQLAVTISNVGFSGMFLPRPVIVVLRSPTGVKYTAEITSNGDIDPRSWQPGAPISFTRNIRVRTAATPIWEASTGYNILTTSLDVDSGAAANTNPYTHEFAPCSACP